MKRDRTSWGSVAGWYENLLEKEGTYQKEVILPNLMRALAPRKGEVILDLACGSGFFSRAFAESGAAVIGADVSRPLIERAEKGAPANASFRVAPAHALPFLKAGSVDKTVIVLAIQNIENIDSVFRECARVMHRNGRLFIVMNHPAFRVPKRSSWEWDEKARAQYRRIDGYMSEAAEKIQMRPGDQPDLYTLSFHRPLQSYMKALRKHGFLLRSLEEWISHKRSDPGPRAAAENKIRKEIPLFLFLEALAPGRSESAELKRTRGRDTIES